MSTKTRRALWALLASFAVYLTPLLQVHGGTLLGVLLGAELAGEGRANEPLWRAVDLGLGLALQLAAFGLFYWTFGPRAWWRWVPLAAAMPTTVLFVNLAYQIVIPTQFLIEPDTAAEHGDWPVACTVEDTGLAAVETGVTDHMAKAAATWVRRDGSGVSFSVLTMPGCQVAEGGPSFADWRGGIVFGTSNGRALLSRNEPGGAETSFWLHRPGADRPRRLAMPELGHYWAPVLSADGAALAWLETRRDAARRVIENRLWTRDLATGKELARTLDLPLRGRYRVVSLDRGADVFIVTRNSDTIFAVGPDGLPRWGPLAPPGFGLAAHNFRLVGTGWVVWDGYRDQGRYRVAWSLAAGEGMREIPKGRAITAVAVDPSGRLIAVSVSRHLNIGQVRDAVYVFRASDGTEVLRRYLPSYARTQLAFLGDDHLAMTEIADGAARIVVLAVPAAAAGG